MGLTGTRKSAVKKAVGLGHASHTHHAGQDAAELAQIFARVFNLNGRDDSRTIPPGR